MPTAAPGRAPVAELRDGLAALESLFDARLAAATQAPSPAGRADGEQALAALRERLLDAVRACPRSAVSTRVGATARALIARAEAAEKDALGSPLRSAIALTLVADEVRFLKRLVEVIRPRELGASPPLDSARDRPTGPREVDEEDRPAPPPTENALRDVYAEVRGVAAGMRELELEGSAAGVALQPEDAERLAELHRATRALRGRAVRQRAEILLAQLDGAERRPEGATGIDGPVVAAARAEERANETLLVCRAMLTATEVQVEVDDLYRRDRGAVGQELRDQVRELRRRTRERVAELIGGGDADAPSRSAAPGSRRAPLRPARRGWPPSS